MLRICVKRPCIKIVLSQVRPALLVRKENLHISTGVKVEKSSIINQKDPNKVRVEINELKRQAGIEKAAIKELEKNPQYQKLAEAFNSHDHVHLRESETEQNDIISLGTIRDYKSSKCEQADKPSSLNLHSHTHSHGHTHSHAAHNPLLVLSTEQIRKNAGVRITWVGLGVNVGIAIGKFFGGIVFHSQALFADAIHAISDMVSDLLTLLSVGLAANKPTADYPYGYGKIETVGSLAVSTILAMAGISIGWSSLCALVGPVIPHTIIDTIGNLGHAHTYSEDIIEDVTDINAAWIAAASIAAKEWIFRATRKIAINTNSNVLMANAWHHRVDSLTSLVALVAISTGYLVNIQSLDTIGGLIVSGLIIKAGGEGMCIAIKELIDQSVSRDDPRYLEIETLVKDTLNKLISNNNSQKPYGLKELTLLSSGPNLRGHLTLEVPLQKWGNILGVNEFEIVTHHLRNVLTNEVSNLRRLDIEYVEEKNGEENEHIKGQQNYKEDVLIKHNHTNTHI
ncbi:BAF_collapsed_G0046270.mRNA.1.CDS.1 [Saccharomyces cerevisiae]|nr:CFA_G0042090.mRNA.1.CDS.1 [Saccharomyces cerevisiae]CAI4970760.1 BAD_HP_G0043530.mRNA.1.CDS.1 [Saccharomyces cerevisiae]CAI5308431.1 BAF_HP2_G0045140.mRNA.1.CDS.1 [Saccharomyces cerevisiae]CAI6676215.1 BAF_HP2_G0045140.mRNA.1.CDS.1 [Saccharomyces cerevisiae]CAI6681891.1 BAF_HP1_G0042200.mRNA.1.CDS.1 [Saccharomyces cerevisiae]